MVIIMFSVIINIGERKIKKFLEKPIRVSDLLKSENISINMPCNGNHICGKCKVLVRGKTNKKEKKEISSLINEKNKDIRLACSCVIEDNAEITILKENLSVLTWFSKDNIISDKKGKGFICDIGTTSIVIQIYDCEKNILLGEESVENIQKIYGADVLSRVQACKDNGVEVLSVRIRTQIEYIVNKLRYKFKIRSFSCGVITGNSIMLHIFENISPLNLAVSPFKLEENFGRKSKYLISGVRPYLPYCIGAYIGADILCGLIFANMKNEISLLIDIGTNGEMVLYKDEKYISCSVASGPAFEGIGLACGMKAIEGAIYKAYDENKKVKVDVIGDTEVKGICGSGIIDIISILKKRKIVDDSGYMRENFYINNKIYITPEDIRKIQLAKAALCVGIYTLIEYTKINENEINKIYLSGGLGSNLNIDSAIEIGLFPDSFRNKIEFLGNSALGGAKNILLNNNLKKMERRILDKTIEINLSSNNYFMNKYIECMYF